MVGFCPHVRLRWIGRTGASQENWCMAFWKCKNAVAILIGILAMTAPFASTAMDVELVGKIGNSAILSINGGAPRAVKIGMTTPEGVELRRLTGDNALVSVKGKDIVLTLGAQPIKLDVRGEPSVTLFEDARGHFTGVAVINGTRVPFLVDTGATFLSLGMSDALRLGIDTSRADRVSARTASGVVAARRVRLASVQIGAINLPQVDALVLEQDMPFILLGMSVLSRLEMVRKNGKMLLR